MFLCKRIKWDTKTYYYQTLERLDTELNSDLYPFEVVWEGFSVIVNIDYLIVLELSRGESRKGSMVKTNLFYTTHYSTKRGSPSGFEFKYNTLNTYIYTRIIQEIYK